MGRRPGEIVVKSAELEAMRKRYEGTIENQKKSIESLKSHLTAAGTAANGAELMAAVLIRRLLAAEGVEYVIVARKELVEAELIGVELIERNDGAVVIRVK